MRDKPFETMAEVDEYLGQELIQCLECGRHYKMLTGKHLRLVHGMTPDEYRQRWGIPRTRGLAGRGTSAERSRIMRDMIDSGRLTYDHLPTASNPETRAPMTPRVPADSARQSALAKSVRPGEHSRIPSGGRRVDGRDADRAREYQQAYRAQQAGDQGPMQRYRERYQTEDARHDQ